MQCREDNGCFNIFNISRTHYSINAVSDITCDTSSSNFNSDLTQNGFRTLMSVPTSVPAESYVEYECEVGKLLPTNNFLSVWAVECSLSGTFSYGDIPTCLGNCQSSPPDVAASLNNAEDVKDHAEHGWLQDSVIT